MNNELELFKPLTRTERQKEAIRNWVNAKCRGSVVFPTGAGKTRVAIIGIQLLLHKFPNLKTVVIVPTEGLKEQWTQILDKEGLSLNSEVLVVNTAAKNASKLQCDLLVLDECHRYASDTFFKVFDIHYKYILGLSATMERVDGRHELILKKAPIIDLMTSAEAIANGWLAKCKEYCILIDVPDIETYNQLTKEFNDHFSFFNFSFPAALSMIGRDGYKKRLAYRDIICPNGTQQQRSEALKNITYHAIGFSRCMQARKKFINEHPEKIRLTKEILKYRQDKKIITFSATINVAEQIGGKVYSGRDSKKSSKQTLQEFSTNTTGVLNTIARANEGLDVPGLSTAVILGQDSSNTKLTQRIGRVSRVEGDKLAEVFTLVINHTTECNWFLSSHKDREYEKLDEQGLMKVLRGEEYTPYKKKLFNFNFKY